MVTCWIVMVKPHDLAPLADAMAAWRRDLHAHPELGFEERRTAAFVAATLRDAGIDVVDGIARTGVVGSLAGAARGSNRAIGLRADMDALAMTEATGLPYASRHPGRMHACGHDGHTAMLLGAALWLARHRDRFAGTIRFVFQPAEESRGGADAMLADGLFARLPVDAIYGLHNLPGLPLGTIAVPRDKVLASSDTWGAVFRGRGTHGAKPHLGTDALLAAAGFMQAIQAIVARETDPLEPAVVSVGAIAAGDPKAPNVIPAEITLAGTARAFSSSVRDHLESRLAGIAAGIAAAHGVAAEVTYTRRLSPTRNHPDHAARMVGAAAATLGAGQVRDDHPPITAGEDFSSFLGVVPGAYAWLGTGEPAHAEGVHHNPHFDFNDAALIHGAAFWCGLALQELVP
jgi:amidohydrolase